MVPLIHWPCTLYYVPKYLDPGVSSQEAALRDYGLGEFSASASIPEERRETDSPNVSTALLFL